MKKNLILVGMMGVGKSTIGRLLSKKLKMTFIDLDRQIEKTAGLEISEIFKYKGEDYFRNMEEKESIKFTKKGGKIIAFGGGTFLNNKVRDEASKTSFSIWLNVSPEIIYKRTRVNKKRPLLTNVKSKKDIEKIYLNRKKIYSYADYELDCSNKNKNQIVKEIKEIYKKND